MRIVSWNCNGAFRKKYKSIQFLDVDVYIIQECEDPLVTPDSGYIEFAQNSLWTGQRNKGVGIFARSEINIKNNNWKTFGLEWYISCTVNENLTLLGIWGSGNYIEDIYVYLQIHKEKLAEIENLLIGGDFNCNTCWDKKHKCRTHSAVVTELESLNLHSCYHTRKKENQGQESTPTFFLYKDKKKPYHLDYFFYDKNQFNDFEIGQYEEWISLSDHMPLILDIHI